MMLHLCPSIKKELRLGETVEFILGIEGRLKPGQKLPNSINDVIEEEEKGDVWFTENRRWVSYRNLGLHLVEDEAVRHYTTSYLGVYPARGRGWYLSDVSYFIAAGGSWDDYVTLRAGELLAGC